MKRIFLSVVTGLLISYSFSVQADGTRVGVVDLQKIMQTYPNLFIPFDKPCKPWECQLSTIWLASG